MAALLEVNITGLLALTFKFDTLASATDPSDALDEVGAVLVNRIRARFLKQKDPDGETWPVSKAALKRTGTGGKGGGTLFDTGTLFHSIQAFRKSVDELAIATDVKYADTHQEGLHGLPQRTFLGFSDDDEKLVVQILQDRIEKALK